MSVELEKPDCSTWNMWEGPEIEGYTDLDKTTLFVRECYDIEDLEKLLPKYERVWFCDEFIYKVSKHFVKTYLLDNPSKFKFDLTYQTFCLLKEQNRTDILDIFQLYVRFNDLTLKEGDHIKIGKMFHEESFLVGNGKKVVPSHYQQDKFIN